MYLKKEIIIIIKRKRRILTGNRLLDSVDWKVVKSPIIKWADYISIKKVSFSFRIIMSRCIIWSIWMYKKG